MASDSYYKDMWLRRNKSAIQVVIVLLAVIAVVLIWQTVYRSRSISGMGKTKIEQASKIEDTSHIRGRVFGNDDDFDPEISDDGDADDRVQDCCTIYDLWQHNSADFECSPLSELDNELPPALVCNYPDDSLNDNYNSVNTETAKHILTQLDKSGDDCGFIDAGAGLGGYSFMSAAIQRSVVAVEPNIKNVERIHKGAKLGRYERWITLLHNKVGQSRDPVYVLPDTPQVKQILLDDIPAFCKFRKAVMRMNLGGQEHTAFQHAKFLFREIQILAVYFDWDNLKQLSSSEDIGLVDEMIKYFNKRGYVPRGYHGKVLSIKKWQQWPNDIFWQKM